MRVPHPFPYQGSKRGIASEILRHFPNEVDCLIEPFCGSGALSIAAASRGFARSFWLNDINEPLMELWTWILERPRELALRYEQLWVEQVNDPKAFFNLIRDEFNASNKPHHFLYLLARVVKGSVRYGSDGSFNQSADNRRLGMRPGTMRQQIIGVASLLQGKTTLSALDFRQVISMAQANDLVYMDPPYQGTSFGRDQRYRMGVAYSEFVDALYGLNAKGVSYIVSYDGQTGEKVYGNPLPHDLGLKRLYISAGRSAQSTLLGKELNTIESLYLSRALVSRLNEKSVEARGLYAFL